MKAFKVVGVLGKQTGLNTETLRNIVESLLHLGCEVLVELHPALHGKLGSRYATRAEMATSCDLVVVIGGDGTLLSAGRDLAESGVPLLGVNQGRLGFMVDIAPELASDRLAEVLDGRYSIEQRLMLQTRVVGSDGRIVHSGVAVNDAVVRNLATIRMLEFHTWLDDSFISAHRADGMIICTPTGSTAYALSGGGPIMHPSLQAIALVPICPHTLSDRPIVIGADQTIRLSVVGAASDAEAWVTLDGQTSFHLEPGCILEVERSNAPMRLIHPEGYDYFEVLRGKLRWGHAPDDPPQRA